MINLWHLYCKKQYEYYLIQNDNKLNRFTRKDHIKKMSLKYINLGLKYWSTQLIWNSEYCKNYIIEFYKNNSLESCPDEFIATYTDDEREFLKKPEKELWEYYCNFTKELKKAFETPYGDYHSVILKYPYQNMLGIYKNWKTGYVNNTLHRYLKKHNNTPPLEQITLNRHKIGRCGHIDNKLDDKNIYHNKKIYKKICNAHFAIIKNKYFKNLQSPQSVDHIFSINSGFEFKIPIWILNCPSNLVIMDKSDNSHKNSANDCLVETLYSNFFNYLNTNVEYKNEIIKSKIYMKI